MHPSVAQETKMDHHNQLSMLVYVLFHLHKNLLGIDHGIRQERNKKDVIMCPWVRTVAITSSSYSGCI